jgi:hypothetical protein
MIVTWQALGNYGNLMFEYAAARSFAEKFNYVTKTDFTYKRNEIRVPEFIDEFLKLEDKHSSKVQEFLPLYDHDFGKIMNLTLKEFEHTKYFNGKVRLEGYFQDSSIFKNIDVNKFFTIDESKLVKKHDDDLCLSLRIGDDYKANNWIIDPNILVNLLDDIWFNGLYIVTDCLDRDYLSYFDKFNPNIVCNNGENPVQDFYNLMSFNSIIIPNSTFSYWAAVLGKSQRIYAPKDWNFNRLNDIIGKENKTLLYSI